MEEFIKDTQYIRLLTFITLFALGVVSLPRLLKKARLFAVGLLIILGTLLILSGISYFISNADAMEISSIVFTAELIGWAFAWAIDIAYYDRD